MNAEEWFLEKLKKCEGKFDFELTQIKHHLQEGICELMEKRCKTPRDLARISKVPYSTVSKFMCSCDHTSIRTIYQLVHALEGTMTISIEMKKEDAID